MTRIEKRKREELKRVLNEAGGQDVSNAVRMGLIKDLLRCKTTKEVWGVLGSYAEYGIVGMRISDESLRQRILSIVTS